MEMFATTNRMPHRLAAHVQAERQRQNELLAYALISGLTLLLAAVAVGMSISQIT